MKSAGVLIFAIGLLACGSQSKPSSSATTPEGAVQLFIAAWMKHDPKAMAKMISPEPTDAKSRAFLEGICKLTQRLEGSAYVATISGDTAAVSYILKSTLVDKTSSTDLEKIALIKIGSEWKLTWNSNSEAHALGPPSVVYALTTPTNVDAATRANDAALCGQNLRVIGEALIKWAYDHNDVLSIPNSQNQIQKLFSKEIVHDVWYCPNDSRTTYSVNLNLVGKSYDNMLRPRQTVLVYEGSNGKLDFRHFGGAMVSFADGHQARVKPSEQSTIAWK